MRSGSATGVHTVLLNVPLSCFAQFYHKVLPYFPFLCVATFYCEVLLYFPLELVALFYCKVSLHFPFLQVALLYYSTLPQGHGDRHVGHEAPFALHHAELALTVRVTVALLHVNERACDGGHARVVCDVYVNVCVISVRKGPIPEIGAQGNLETAAEADAVRHADDWCRYLPPVVAHRLRAEAVGQTGGRVAGCRCRCNETQERAHSQGHALFLCFSGAVLRLVEEDGH
jgi:hypothetical protein